MDKRVTKIIILFSVIILAGVGIYFRSAGSKQTGLYEYVRKANKYIEENKYKKAIFLFHKAYEEAPSSRDIRENLFYGYIKYSRALEKAGELDEAIYYLEMANEIDPSSVPVSHDLSILYAKKALEMSRNKKIDAAIKELQRSVELAIVDKKIRRNLSVFLFNSAVNAYNKNDDSTFLLAANTSYVLKIRFDTLDLLGQFFYKKTELREALFYWQKAQTLKPNDTKISNKITNAEKEMVIDARMKEIKTEHFNVRLYRNYKADPAALGKILRRIYSQVGSDLDYYPPLTTPIIFYDETDFRNLFDQKGMVRAFYDGNIRMIFTTEASLPALIAHEYTHVVLSMITDNRCPAWLHEGIAVYEQSRYAPLTLLYVKDAVKNDRKLTVRLLEKEITEMDNAKETALSYEAAYTAVSFILDKWGWPGLKNLLKKIKDGRHFANAIDEEFYISVQTFEKIWNEYLKERFS